MNDTPPRIIQKICQMIRKKSPIERLEMGCSMYQTSKYLIIRAIMEENPNISPIDLRKEFFLKFYGNDFTPQKRKEILNHFEKHFSDQKSLNDF